MKASPHRPTKALIHLGAIRQNIQQMEDHIPEGTGWTQEENPHFRSF